MNPKSIPAEHFILTIYQRRPNRRESTIQPDFVHESNAAATLLTYAKSAGCSDLQVSALSRGCQVLAAGLYFRLYTTTKGVVRATNNRSR